MPASCVEKTIEHVAKLKWHGTSAGQFARDFGLNKRAANGRLTKAAEAGGIVCVGRCCAARWVAVEHAERAKAEMVAAVKRRKHETTMQGRRRKREATFKQSVIPVAAKAPPKTSAVRSVFELGGAL